MDRLTNHPFCHFWRTIALVIYRGTVLILVPGPGLALIGPGSWSDEFANETDLNYVKGSFKYICMRTFNVQGVHKVSLQFKKIIKK